ncbi:MAG: type II secretion system secretin GspD [Proteobacteria bacterium]|jgi:general secretion pathway protein D|nr:type II secretion system secretin GspD [Pseudomonadota bacterium]
MKRNPSGIGLILALAVFLFVGQAGFAAAAQTKPKGGAADGVEVDDNGAVPGTNVRPTPGVLRARDIKKKVPGAAASAQSAPGKTGSAAGKKGAGAASGGDPAGGSGGATGATPAGGSGGAIGDPTDPWGNVKDAGEMAIGIDYQKPKPGTRFAFNLVDADLIELIKIIGNITGKSFILGGKAPNIKATIYAPTKITAEEAYQAFLSVLQVNGLVVVPAGRYLKILPVGGSTQQNTPVLTGTAPARDQIVTQLYPLQNVAAEDLAPVLDRFKSQDGDITVYAPTNTLIITDYGTSIRRLLKFVALLDVPGTGEKIWIEPVNYASATELADRIMQIFDQAGGGSGKAAGASAAGTTTRPKKGKAAAAESGGVFGERDGETKISKIIPDERTNSLIIVASEHAYLRILELVKMLDVPIAGEGTLHVHKLQHADATELAKTLSNLSRQAGGSTAGRKKEGGKAAAPAAAAIGEGAALFEGEMQISADKATNSLVIVSSLRDYLSLKTVIEILDTMQRQVFVEAVIMEVSLDKNRDIGLGVHGGNTVGSGNDQSLVYGSSQTGDSSNSFSQVLSVPALTGLAAGVVGPEIDGSEDIVGVSVPAFGVALHALQTNSDVNVLSTPHILATDNIEASIQVGENVPVQQGMNASSLLGSLGGRTNTDSTSALTGLAALSGYGGLGSSIGRQNVGITLKVTPHINDDNQVRLEIDLEISEVKSIDPITGPTISKQNAVTTSVVADQQTIVIGGLITDNQVETTTKVPVLGDIPILGMLFRHKSSLTKKRNLLIFLTPYIVRSAEDFREIFSRKMAERREFIERYTAFEYHRYDPHLDWSRTNGAIAVVDQVIGQAQKDEELRQMSTGVPADGHNPKSPIELPPGMRIGEGVGEGDETSGAPSEPVEVMTPPGFVREQGRNVP